MNALRTAITLSAWGCGTLNNARPLDQGAHRAGLTFGGPVLMALGPPIPVPNLILEGQSGLKPIGNLSAQADYGLNLTAMAFGVMGVHGGGTVGLMEQQRFIPALSLSDRLHFYNNYPDTTKDLETRQAFGLNELELTASWALGNHLLYTGLSNHLDINDPELTLGYFIGAQIGNDKGLFGQLELHHMAANRRPDIVDVEFLTTGTGSIALTTSLGWAFGDSSKGED